jgi:hypothetical protein
VSEREGGREREREREGGRGGERDSQRDRERAIESGRVREGECMFYRRAYVEEREEEGFFAIRVSGPRRTGQPRDRGRGPLVDNQCRQARN